MKKTIDGKTFYLSGSWADKIDALREAKQLHKKGYQVRAITKPRYYIYRYQVWSTQKK